MKLIETTKANKIAAMLEERTGESVQIRFGAEDARYKEQYYAYATTWNGFQACGTYGKCIAGAKTLKGLLG